MFSVHVNHLHKKFGTRVILRDVSFTHSSGLMGVAGPNGSGKSTLLQCLAGLKHVTGGEINWHKNNSVLKPPERTQHLGFAAPYINLYDELSCRENLEFLLKLRKKSLSPRHIDALLERVGLTPVADNLFGRFSTGQQQRARLAAALIHQPDILLLDEPGSNLDEQGRNMITNLLEGLKKTDTLVILASNNPDELHQCDRIFSVEEEQFLDH